MVARPDEEASLAEIEREKKFRNVGSSAVGIGASALGAGMASRVAPFLSQYVPVDLAIKGISKISPPIGDFLKRGMSMGLDGKEGIQFIKDQVETKKESPKQDKNPIEQYSPELHQFITEQIQNGQSPEGAAALATLERKGQKGFKSIIEKIVKDHKSPFLSLVRAIYGKGEKGPEAQEATSPSSQQPDSPNSGDGGIDPEFDAIIQGGAAFLKKYRG